MNDLKQQMLGRAKFLRDRGEVKTPELLERAVEELRDSTAREEGRCSLGDTGFEGVPERVNDQCADAGTYPHSPVTDAMVEAALRASVPGGSEVWCWLPQKDAWTPSETARDVMRCALKAAFVASKPCVSADSAAGKAVTSAAEALERLDEAEGLCRWACVTMENKERYAREVAAFWDVVEYLRAVRDGGEAALPKPTAWLYRDGHGLISTTASSETAKAWLSTGVKVVPLYAAPQAPAAELPEDVVRPETGWLIEEFSTKTHQFKGRWWDGDAFTADSNAAIRFARREDAQKFIDNIGWTEGVPTEHRWG